MSDRAPQAGRLPFRTYAAYGQIGLPLAIADIPVILYLLPFYAGEVGVNLAVFGTVKMLARLADTVTDVAIGAASDRTRVAFGRRRLWVLLGLPVMMAGVYMLFLPPPDAGWLHLFIWLSAFYLGWTMITIPYGAWGAELSGVYEERSRLTGARAMFVFLGVLLATILPVVIGAGVGTEQGLRPVMTALGLGTLVVLPLSALLLLALVPEPPFRPLPAMSWRRGVKAALDNAAFLRLLASAFVSRIGVGINQSAVLLYFAFGAGLGGESGIPLLAYLVTAFLGAPLWVKAGDLLTKHRALCLASLFGVGSFLGLLLVPEGALLPATLVMASAGLSGAASLTLGTSIAADVVELDELKSREARAGLLLAFWGLAQKMADAIGVGLAAYLLAGFGVDPEAARAGVPLTDDAIFGLTMTYIAVPVVFFLGSLGFIWNFPLTPDRQRRIRALLVRRAAQRQRANASASNS